MVLSVVDIETTGGSHGNYPTEFACYKLVDGKITSAFTSLIKPPVDIPPFIQKLTGIRSDMLEDAPTFEEIALEIFDFLKETTFVAHNVAFDYGVLKSAFERVNITFNLERLCSIQMARKVFPNERSYSLGKLCKALDIPLENRHRAHGDALATAHLIKKILAHDNGILQHNLQQNKKQIAIPSHLDPTQFENLPNNSGVYFFLDQNKKPLYIGKAKNIKRRVYQHFTENTSKKAELKKNIHHLDYLISGSELLAELIESEEIKKYWPPFNKVQKHTSYTFSIFSYKNQIGAIRLGIEKNDLVKSPLISFSNLGECYRFLDDLSREFGLCQKLISGKSKAKDCLPCQKNGYKCPRDKEDFIAHNGRMKKAISSFLPLNGNFLILEKGRNEQEKALIWVQNLIYKGFAFVPLSHKIQTENDFLPFLVPQKNNNDVQRILKKYLRRKIFPQLIPIK